MAHRNGFWPRLALVLCLAASAGAAHADYAEQAAAMCEGAIARGARTTGVPQSVLHAISLTETGRRQGDRMRPWPWAINREGRGYWFATRDEAMAFARQSLAEGRPSFDVGCFQINYRWHGDHFPSIEAMFDPEVGARYAAGFLRELYAESGDWSAAAGAYHSRTPHFANTYRARFDRILAGLGGSPLLVAQASAEEEGPRKSRTRMTRGPLIIRIERTPPDAVGGNGSERTAGIRASRFEKVLVTDARPGRQGRAPALPASRAI